MHPHHWRNTAYDPVKLGIGFTIRCLFVLGYHIIYKKSTSFWRRMSITVIGSHFRYHLVGQVPARFVCNFLPNGKKIYCSPPSSRRRQLSTGQSHLYLQICRSCFSKKKSTPDGVLFFLLLVYTLDIAFQPLKTYHWASKSQIFRSQVSTIHINTW